MSSLCRPGSVPSYVNGFGGTLAVTSPVPYSPPVFFNSAFRFRWRTEGGGPGQVGRPGPRPALLGRPRYIPGVPSRPECKTLLAWGANGRCARSWAARLRIASGIVHRPQMRKSPALRTAGADLRGLRHARHCVGGFVPAACTKGSLGGCAEASDSTRQSPSFHEIRGFKFFQMEILKKRGGSGPPLVYSRFFGSTGYPTEGMANATAQGIIPQT